MPYPANVSERQRQLSTSLSTSTPSQSKMMRSGLIITSFPDPIRAYTQGMGNNPFLPARYALLAYRGPTKPRPEAQRARPTKNVSFAESSWVMNQHAPLMRRFGVDLDDRANDVLKLCQRRTAGRRSRFDTFPHRSYSRSPTFHLGERAVPNGCEPEGRDRSRRAQTREQQPRYPTCLPARPGYGHSDKI